jgi:tubulin monoglycylase TTLL3/8
MDPLTIWIYDECYLRFGLEDYNMNPNKIHDLYMHLTNNSVIKNSTAYDAAEIQGCMWHVRQFQEYLSSTFGSDIWRQKIFPRMKDIIKWSLMSVTSKVPQRTHSFELLGYDFMIDTDFTPWLLEVNTSPAMDYSTKITETLVKKVLSDTIEVVLNDEEDKNEVGLFKLYYKGRKGA